VLNIFNGLLPVQTGMDYGTFGYNLVITNASPSSAFWKVTYISSAPHLLVLPPGEWFIFSERELSFTFAICYRQSVCHLSVTFVRPTQAVQIFGNASPIWPIMCLVGR